ncbi:MAG: nitroreductase family deazaflavin-dependent oxidoreductase [Jiangellaceae bacterium]|nr:nitroreductase family deazaflavin-dependent oxidoreductase [Jiangellaceae bacterium]
MTEDGVRDDVKDSPIGWVHRHIRQYVESGGEKGHEWRPRVPTLLLTTIGRRTGNRYRTALIYGRDGDDYVVVGSKGGSHRHPAWFLNLTANPRVDVQVGPEKFPAVAGVAEGAKRKRLWAMMNRIWPSYESYQQRTNREIPVVVLRRGDAGHGEGA